uniref:DDE Tnp4 domain-containing protein n=1 Tax=Lactuca sativa TaxID=4236 RepID=A0A9R1WB91_LACSA|nr:hypothetical protein LSAT_V11C200098430 [Lactuca sativa]
MCFQPMLRSLLIACIECSFGVLRKMWKILNIVTKFNENTQINVITRTFTLHNYIRRNDPKDMIFNIVQQHNYIPRKKQENHSKFSH